MMPVAPGAGASSRTVRNRIGLGIAALVAVLVGSAAPARGLDRLCDPASEDCRAILLSHIRAETKGIDVAFWFMEDARYTSELIRKFQSGVPVRVLMDLRANDSNQYNAERLAELERAGIPLRRRTASGILHYKMMLFSGQGVVEFSGANFSADAWVYTGPTPYVNYVAEAAYFTDKPSFVQSFMSKYDDLWTNTVQYADYANVPSALVRNYGQAGTYVKDPQLNFPPIESYATRAVGRYTAETRQIDVIMYRITDRRHTDAMIAASVRGIPVRLFTEPQSYRDPTRLWHAWNVDRMYAAGIPVRIRAHAGLNHQKLVLLHGQRLSIFGSSNWTSPSDRSQEEHNCFCTAAATFDWFTTMFERKWYNLAGVAESAAFVPLPPDKPDDESPANAATGLPPGSLVLKWHGGPWAHKYDLLLGTDPARLEPVMVDTQLGPSESAAASQSFSATNLLPGTTYYWRVVSRTMANMSRSGDLWSFTTGDTIAPPDVPPPVSGAPIGSFDTPVSGTVVTGEVGVTGWAVDDSGVAGVDIYRSPVAGEPTQSNGLVFIGAATQVAGARPDIVSAYGSYPGVQRAGWGYMLLSNMLPNQGNGTFTLSASVRTVDGAHVFLGSRTIVGANATAVSPFGTIDTPGQGQTVSGVVTNFGWALAPAANAIPADGSTIDVYIDDVFRGHPSYNNFRSDIATLFPGHANSNGAVGFFTFDSTALSNGVHSIAWVVRDSAGHGSGMGSRFFSVANPVSSTVTAAGIQMGSAPGPSSPPIESASSPTTAGTATVAGEKSAGRVNEARDAAVPSGTEVSNTPVPVFTTPVRVREPTTAALLPEPTAGAALERPDPATMQAHHIQETLMANDGLSGKREHEEDYFRKQDQELVQKMRKAGAAAEARRALGAQSGIQDPDLLDDVSHLGFSAETVGLLPLMPILQVAWAEGGVSPAERTLMVELARTRGIVEDSPADAQLAEWLTHRPAADVFSRAARLIAAIVAADPRGMPDFSADDLVSHCERIAAASGGFLGLGKVSPAERTAIEQIHHVLKSRR